MNRRGFLNTIGAAFCGAMLCTFPDFGTAGIDVRLRPTIVYGYFTEYARVRIQYP